MGKKILIFFILGTLLFSNDEYILSNGRMSLKYNSNSNKIIRLNGNMSTNQIDIKTLEVEVYYKGLRYRLSDYIISRSFLEKTNIFETISELPFGTVKTTYIPSMIDKNSFYILNEFQTDISENIEFIYQLDTAAGNGVLEYKKSQDYYNYNDNIYIKNLKNSMTGYIAPKGNYEATKLKKIDGTTIKYINENIILISKLRKNSEKSDIIQISYGTPSKNNSFETRKRILSKEALFWEKWFKPLPLTVDAKTKQIIERFLVYLKTSTDGLEFYTNIGIYKEYGDKKSAIYMLTALMKYKYYDDVKYLIDTMIAEDENQKKSNDENGITLIDIEEVYMYLNYIKESHDTEFYYKNQKTIKNKMTQIYKNLENDINKNNLAKKGYEFEKYYYGYRSLKLYRVLTKDNEFVLKEEELLNYIIEKFIMRNGIKKYAIDKEITYSKWEYLVFFSKLEAERQLDILYQNSNFRKNSYLDNGKILDIDKNLKVLKGLYVNEMSRYGDINLAQLNSDIINNSMKIPTKIYLEGEKKYGIEVIDIYLVSKYLLTLYDRSN